MSQTNQVITVASADPSGLDTQSTKRKRILIAESDGFTRMVLMLQFRMIGFGVDFTANGNIALRKFKAQLPDALLLELKLSGLPGLELIKAARAESQFANRPIYVFTDPALLKRATRKEVLTLAIRVFDKRSVSREKLVRTIVCELTQTEAGEQQTAPTMQAKQTEAPGEMLQPEEVGEIVDGVRTQWELVLKSKANEQRVESTREFHSRVCSLGTC